MTGSTSTSSAAVIKLKKRKKSRVVRSEAKEGDETEIEAVVYPCRNEMCLQSKLGLGFIDKNTSSVHQLECVYLENSTKNTSWENNNIEDYPSVVSNTL
ncbi:hypothetical protein LINGRAHAP2_LOCUS9771 [Linum grandiflorum]